MDQDLVGQLDSPMTVDEKVFVRNEAYRNKDFRLSDRLRNELEEELVFILDHPDRTQTVYFLTEKFFEKMKPEMTKKKFFEFRLKAERDADKLFDAWLYSQKESLEIYRQQ